MELQRSHGMLALAAFLVLGGAAMIALTTSVFALVLGGLGVLLGAGFAWAHLTSAFLFVIGPAGLTVRTKGIDRLLPWEEIAAIVLDRQVPSTQLKYPPHFLLLVPVRGSELAARDDLTTIADGTTGLVVLDFDDVRDARADVVAALRVYGGDRFRDAVHAREVEEVVAPPFDEVAGGYDAGPVDRLALEARDALANGPFQARHLVKLKIKWRELPTAAFGYDREQVDRYLDRLSELLFKL